MTSRIGRLDLQKGLKRFFELTGKTQLSLGEGIVPTVSIGDLDKSPFATSMEWYARASLTGGVGTNGYAEVRIVDANPNVILTLEAVHTLTAGGNEIQIFALESTIGVGVVAAPRTVKILGGRIDPVGLIELKTGALAGIAGGAGYGWLSHNTNLRPFRTPVFAVNGAATIFLVNQGANTTENVVLCGLLHRTSSV